MSNLSQEEIKKIIAKVGSHWHTYTEFWEGLVKAGAEAERAKLCPDKEMVEILCSELYLWKDKLNNRTNRIKLARQLLSQINIQARVSEAYTKGYNTAVEHLVKEQQALLASVPEEKK